MPLPFRPRHVVLATLALAVPSALYLAPLGPVSTGEVVGSIPEPATSSSTDSPPASAVSVRTEALALPVPAVPSGREYIVVAGHFDGVDRMSASTLSAWMRAAEQNADAMRAAGIPDTWELTAGEVKKFEAAQPGWLASIEARGTVMTPREPHLNDPGGDAFAARAALASAGVAPSVFLGSALDPRKYLGGPWLVVGTGSTPGHSADTDLSGLEVVGEGLSALYTGTADSVAIKQKIARMVSSGSLPGAYEIVRYNGANPQTGGQPWFVSPVKAGSTKPPVPIVQDLQRLQSDLVKEGLADTVVWTRYEPMLQAWEAAGRPAPYVVPR